MTREKRGSHQDAVQRHGDKNHDDVEVEECVVLCQAVGNQSRADKVDEVEVEAKIDNQENALFGSVPDDVNVVV